MPANDQRNARETMTVLVIDPDLLNRDVAVTMLRHAGFRVLHADEVEMGIRLARECVPALIVTELFERTEEGWDILERFAATPEVAGVPVIAFSAHVMPPDREAAQHAGISRFLSKPLPPQELESVVEELLGLADLHAPDA